MDMLCLQCAKGSDIASVDNSTGKIERLFNPRVDRWDQHFSLADQGTIDPLSAIGRVTVSLLKLNRPELVEIRKALGPGWSRKPR